MSTSDAKLPLFRDFGSVNAPVSFEQLWSDLRTTRKHEFLRAPQQEALERYVEIGDARDIALELPTGTGKTAVALLIGEWRRRRSNRPVAYLTLTNQLAGQVLQEAQMAGVPFADIRGDKRSRNAEEVGKYRTAEAIGVTTYSNLFNVNPVVVESDLLILDDVHGGEDIVADMWTVRVPSRAALYQELLAVLRPALTKRQTRALEQGTNASVPDLVHLAGAPQCVDRMIEVLDSAVDAKVRFPWIQLRGHLEACLVFISVESITIRPLIPPTHTHAQFANSAQRLFLSATVGELADLRRSYGVGEIQRIRSSQKPTGRRFIFSPTTYASPEESDLLAAAVWDRLDPRRALLITPSRLLAESTYGRLVARAQNTPKRMDAQEVTDSLTTFTNADDTILVVPSRYDGIDLPHDACRLMLLAGSPSAIGELERHLQGRWAAGPILRAREATRFVQGLGRCTRGDTDYAIVMLLGQGVSNLITRPSVSEGLPAHIRGELDWGVEQSKLAADNMESLGDMIVGILADPQYRAAAESSIATMVRRVEEEDARSEGGSIENSSVSQVVVDEISYSRSIWEGYLEGAYKAARSVADSLGGDALRGYRAWWWYLASTVAEHADDTEGVVDCRRRAIACGINPGFVSGLPEVQQFPLERGTPTRTANAANMWNFIDDKLGWAGLGLNSFAREMKGEIGSDKTTKFHMGLEKLGCLLGAEVTRRTDDGVPDVVWSFDDDVHLAFEVKIEKRHEGKLSKRDVQQAVGHVNWVRQMLAVTSSESEIHPVILSPTNSVHEAARPHLDGLAIVEPSVLREWADEVVESIRAIRASFSGREYASAEQGFVNDLEEGGLDETSVVERFTETKLVDLV